MQKHTLMQLLVFLSAMICFSASAEAASVITGTLDATFPTWNRTSDRTNSLGVYMDSANDSLPYEVLEIKTTVVGDLLTATVNSATQFDSFLALYSTFDPAAPLLNLRAADDDSGGYPHAQLVKSGLAANTSYYLVISSYSNSADSVFPLYGNYQLTLGGSFFIVPKGTTTAVSAAPNPSAFGQAITLTATVTKGSVGATPTGTVTFFDGTTTIGSGMLAANGQASLTLSSLSAGGHAVTAVYGGDTKYTASTSTPLTVSVVLPPSVTGITPTSGSTAGGTQVVISGNNFTGATAVSFGNTAAAGFTVNSDSKATASSPAGVAGMIIDISVTTPGGTSVVSTSDQFTYIQDQARNVTTGISYTFLTDALSSAQTGAVIRALDTQLFGAFILGTSITLRGGWDSAFLNPASQPTTLSGSLTVQNGESTAETIVVKGQLAVQGGLLHVKDVKVKP